MNHSDLAAKEPLLTVEDVAKYFTYSTFTITRWIKEKGCPAQQMPDGQFRLKLSEVNTWIDDNNRKKRENK